MRLPFLCAVLALSLFAATATAIQYPLNISSDGRVLLDASGEPLFLNATTPWHLVARLDRDQVISYLDERRAQGVNAILMSLVVPGSYSGSVLNAYGEAPFTTAGDFSTPNEAYFAHADWILEQARLRDMVVLLCHTYVGYGCGEEGWCAEMQAQGAAAMRAWGRWLGQRYRNQPNIIWVDGGDVDANAYGAGALVDAIAEGILQFDSQHLHTAHCARYLGGAECYDRTWLDIDSSYGDCSTTADEVRDAYQRWPLRPNLYLEGRYEAAAGGSAACMRRQAWLATLGGASGHAYGHTDIWDFPSAWSNAMQAEGAQSLLVLREFVDSRPWHQLVPDIDHRTVVSGYGSLVDAGYVAAARARDGSSVVVYFPDQRQASVDLGRIAGTTAEAWWFDPSSGNAMPMGGFPTTGVHDFLPPSPGDWLLVIDDEAAPLPDLSPPATPTPREAPSQLRVGNPYPNPFNPRTSIRFRARAGARVTVDLYDSRGRMLGRVHEGTANGNDQELTWDARDLASGVYQLRIQADNDVQKRRIVLVR